MTEEKQCWLGLCERLSTDRCGVNGIIIQLYHLDDNEISRLYQIGWIFMRLCHLIYML